MGQTAVALTARHVCQAIEGEGDIMLVIQRSSQGQALLIERPGASVVALEKGDYAPSVLLALRIARYFGKPLEDAFNLGAPKRQKTG